MIDIENLLKESYTFISLTGLIARLKKNVSELIHKRFNEEGPWPDAAKAYEELISKMETAEGSQKKILEKLQNFFASSNN